MMNRSEDSGGGLKVEEPIRLEKWRDLCFRVRKRNLKMVTYEMTQRG